jgi:hypothetical protein
MEYQSFIIKPLLMKIHQQIRINRPYWSNNLPSNLIPPTEINLWTTLMLKSTLDKIRLKMFQSM